MPNKRICQSTTFFCSKNMSFDTENRLERHVNLRNFKFQWRNITNASFPLFKYLLRQEKGWVRCGTKIYDANMKSVFTTWIPWRACVCVFFLECRRVQHHVFFTLKISSVNSRRCSPLLHGKCFRNLLLSSLLQIISTAAATKNGVYISYGFYLKFNVFFNDLTNGVLLWNTGIRNKRLKYFFATMPCPTWHSLLYIKTQKNELSLSLSLSVLF